MYIIYFLEAGERKDERTHFLFLVHNVRALFALLIGGYRNGPSISRTAGGLPAFLAIFFLSHGAAAPFSDCRRLGYSENERESCERGTHVVFLSHRYTPLLRSLFTLSFCEKLEGENVIPAVFCLCRTEINSQQQALQGKK